MGSNVGPREAPSQEAAPHEAAPQEAAPHEGGPQEAAPHEGGPREVEIPVDLAEALAQDDVARANLERMPPSHRREWLRWVTEAKKPETRAARIAKTVQSLHAGNRSR